MDAQKGTKPTVEDSSDKAVEVLQNEEKEKVPENRAERLPYPKSVFFIVSNEFCERFSFYGMRTILALYLKNQLHYTDTTATVIYHVFIMVCYFFPLVGAIISDSWLGMYKTIMYLSMVYAFGNIVVSVSAIPNVLPPEIFTMIGLFLIALGTGGIKPCVAAFGGDQFTLPQQEDQLQKFFSIFYFAINSGSFVSTFLTPLLREVKCFDEDSCYSLAFGVPAMLMILAIVLYLSGRSWYKIKKPEGNIVVKVAKCMWHAATTKSEKEVSHWLDKAQDKYDKPFINDIKATLRVLVLFIPIPIFWALFDQQGSRWTFQAARMNGELGGFKIQPDQMQMVNPILILAFIPFFESVVYPLLAKCNLLKRPLQKLCVGGFIAAAAFGISALVETQLEPTYPDLPQPGEGQIRFYNAFTDPVKVSSTNADIGNFTLAGLEVKTYLHIKVSGNQTFQITYQRYEEEEKKDITVYENEATSYTFLHDSVLEVNKENVDKSDNGDPKIMIIYSEKGLNFQKNISFVEKDTGNIIASYNVTSDTPYVEYNKLKLVSGNYTLMVDAETVKNDIEMKQGGVYVALVTESSTKLKYEANILTITNPNSVHILWLIPQYVVITIAEIMLSITGIEFSFTQAPSTMKSLVQAVWLLTVAFGNLVVIIVAEAKIFSSQTFEFLLFAGLMAVDMMIFALMAMRYTYVEDLPEDDSHSKPAVHDEKFHEEDIVEIL